MKHFMLLGCCLLGIAGCDTATHATPDSRTASTAPDNNVNHATPDSRMSSTAPDNTATHTTTDSRLTTTTPDDTAHATTDSRLTTTAPDNTATHATTDSRLTTTTPDKTATHATPDSRTTSTAPDNTGINARDRDQSVKTPFDQKENKQDIDVTAAIRKRVVASDMSTDAKNVKIITENGMVTLRGPVKSAEEKKEVNNIATQVAGDDKVDDQLEIASSR